MPLPPRARASVQFRQLLLPELLRLVGDPKSNTIEAHTVVAYAERRGLLLDKQQVLDMFAEADFKHEGRLGVMQLVGALEGRSAIEPWTCAAIPALSLLSCGDKAAGKQRCGCMAPHLAAQSWLLRQASGQQSVSESRHARQQGGSQH